GPSFSNPRTGEIIGADVMLEFVFIANRLRLQRIFGLDETSITGPEALARPFAGGRDGRRDFLRALAHGAHAHEGAHGHGAHGHTHDGHTHQGRAHGHHEMGEASPLGALINQGVMAGRVMLDATIGEGDDGAASQALLEQAVMYLAAHEVGHTFGLSHNMRASHYLPVDELGAAGEDGTPGPLAASVMDYPPVRLPRSGEPTDGFRYYDTGPGPYDEWAIKFGYYQYPDDAEAARIQREALLSRSTEPGLAFGNDADDMRSPGRGVDPRIMVGDLSSEPLDFAEARVALVREASAALLERTAEPGESWERLINGFVALQREQASAAVVASRYVGGLYIDRAAQGQPGATVPYAPTSRAEQKRALSIVADAVLGPDAFSLWEDVLARLQPERRGFDLGRGTEDPKLHGFFLGLQLDALSHLIHPVTLRRLTDMQLYGGAYTPVDLMSDLNDIIFGGRSGADSLRRPLQIAYVEALLAIFQIGPEFGYDADAQSAALYALKKVERRIAWDLLASPEQAAHQQHLRTLISQAL
ncbi:MAG: zinc-dependent metalloprotease, partial [Pseudomonadota bacterium]